MKTQTATELQERALATLLRTDGISADSADAVRFEDSRYGGHYVLVRKAGQVVAIYKMVVHFGPARSDGKGNFVVSDMSMGIRRIKRAPRGLITSYQEASK